MSNLLVLHSIFFTNSIKDLFKKSEKLQQALYLWNRNRR